MPLEPLPSFPRVRDITAGLGRHTVVNGVVALLFGTTGPLAILLSVARRGGLDEGVTNSWIFASYALAGGLSIIFSLAYRQPLGMAWTIPGAVLLVPAFDHLAFPHIVGAYFATAALLVATGVTGWAQRAMAFVPLPVVMGMVAGVFLPFATGIVAAFDAVPGTAAAMVLGFFVVSGIPRLARTVPPVLASLAIGVVVMLASGQVAPTGGLGPEVVRPVLHAPVFSARALLELVVPLALTVIAIQNAQGFAILRTEGYDPPENVLTVACGVGSFAFGALGSVPACVTGPVNGILNSSGPKESRYVGGVVFGVLMVVFGTFAPVATRLASAVPGAFIAVLGGLALVPVLRAAFGQAFGGRFVFGALTSFVVTASNTNILRVSSAFWGLLFGLAASWLLERDDFPRALGSRGSDERRRTGDDHDA